MTWILESRFLALDPDAVRDWGDEPRSSRSLDRRDLPCCGGTSSRRGKYFAGYLLWFHLGHQDAIAPRWRRSSRKGMRPARTAVNFCSATIGFGLSTVAVSVPAPAR